MNIETFREYCLSKPGAEESFPFDDHILVFKIGGKMFVAVDVDEFVSFNAKCDPAKAIELREQYSGITPGYHMSKKHWNTILTDGSVPDQLMFKLIDHSYELVLSGLPRYRQHEIMQLK